MIHREVTEEKQILLFSLNLRMYSSLQYICYLLQTNNYPPTTQERKKKIKISKTIVQLCFDANTSSPQAVFGVTPNNHEN